MTPLIIIGHGGYGSVQCDDPNRAMLAAAFLILRTGGQASVSVLGPDGEWRWTAAPYASRDALTEGRKS